MPPVPESDQALDWVRGNLPAEEISSPAEEPVSPVEDLAVPASAETPAAEMPADLPQPSEPDVSAEAVIASLPEPGAAELAAPPDVPASVEPAPEASLPELTASLDVPGSAGPAPELLPVPAVVEELPLPPLPPTEPLSLENLVESLLFVAEGPVPVSRLAEALEVSLREVEAALDQLTEAYQQRGLSVQRLRDRVQLTTTPAAADKVQRFLGLAAATPLSRAALETLAIIAYQQPVTRPQIEAVRGVNSDGVIKNLLSKGIIDEVGRTDGPGRPVLYATTPEFLQYFGITSLADLPPLNLDQRPASVSSGSTGSALKE
jgi:segregation and condensation protein B